MAVQEKKQRKSEAKMTSVEDTAVAGAGVRGHGAGGESGCIPIFNHIVLRDRGPGL